MQRGSHRRIIYDDDDDDDTNNGFVVNEEVRALFIGDGEFYNATILRLEPYVVVQWDADNSITEGMEIWQLERLNGERAITYHHPNFFVGEFVQATPVNKHHASLATIVRINQHDVLLQWQQGRAFTNGIPFDRLRKLSDNVQDSGEQEVNPSLDEDIQDSEQEDIQDSEQEDIQDSEQEDIQDSDEEDEEQEDEEQEDEEQEDEEQEDEEQEDIQDSEEEDGEDMGFYFRINAQHAHEQTHKAFDKMSQKNAFTKYIMHIAYGLTEPEFLTKLRDAPQQLDGGHTYNAAICKIEDHLRTFGESVLASGAWDNNIIAIVKCYSNMTITEDQVPHKACDGCNKTRCALQLKNEVVMHDGNSNRMHVWDTVWNRYVDPGVLFYETQTRDTSIHPVTVYMTNHCTRRLRLYHEFYHYKYHLINDVRRYMSSQMNDWDTFIQGKRMEHQDLIARIVKAGKTYNTSRDQFI